MVPDGTYTAVLDELEGALARLEVEAEGSGDLYELVVESETLPADGREPGAVMTVEVVDEEVIKAEYRAEETRKRRERARDRFERLSRRATEDEGQDRER
jgi:hypothetical protein